MSRIRTALVLSVQGLLLASLATSAQANAVSVNFDNGGAFVVTGTAGVAPFGNWNDLTTVNTTTPNLLDSTGTNSGASITTSHFDALYPFGGYTNDGANGSMLDSGAYSNSDNTGGSVKINMTSIPYAKYDVYIYSNPNAADGRTSDFTIGATTIPMTAIAAPAPYTLGRNYIEFTGLTGSSFSVFTQAIINIQSSVSGLQVVDATPEPASWLLMGLGAVAMCGLSRQRAARNRMATARRTG